MQQNNNNGDASLRFSQRQVPRSIRWRLQLGILEVPCSVNEESNQLLFMDKLLTWNQSRVALQRDLYQKMAQKHDESRYLLSTSKNGGKNMNLSSTENEKTQIIDLDPLSRWILIQDAKENPIQANHDEKNATNKDDDDNLYEILDVLDKDLHRLPEEHLSYYRSLSNWNNHLQNQNIDTDIDTARNERNERLKQMLFVYHQEHPKPGYQQGMHEIFSYILFTFEMDLFDIVTSNHNDVFGYLLESKFILHDAYTFAEAVLDQIRNAYGVSDEINGSPVEQMGNSILQKIQYVARDKELYIRLQTLEWGLPLYTARWVRLMFAREVDSWRNLLSLWDIVFDCISSDTSVTSMHPYKYTRPGVSPPFQVGKFRLMTVLEMTAASLIWLHRKRLLKKQIDEGLQMINVNPLREVRPLISTLLSSLRRFQISSTMAPLLHPEEIRRNYIDRETTNPSASNNARQFLSNPRNVLQRILSSQQMVSSPVKEKRVATMHRRRSSLPNISLLEPEEFYVPDSWNKTTSSLSPKSIKQKLDRLLGASKAIFFPPLHNEHDEEVIYNISNRNSNNTSAVTKSPLSTLDPSSSISESLSVEKAHMGPKMKTGKRGINGCRNSLEDSADGSKDFASKCSSSTDGASLYSSGSQHDVSVSVMMENSNIPNLVSDSKSSSKWNNTALHFSLSSMENFPSPPLVIATANTDCSEQCNDQIISIKDSPCRNEISSKLRKLRNSSAMEVLLQSPDLEASHESLFEDDVIPSFYNLESQTLPQEEQSIEVMSSSSSYSSSSSSSAATARHYNENDFLPLITTENNDEEEDKRCTARSNVTNSYFVQV
jgi:Rab-GTPase-TBC domain